MNPRRYDHFQSLRHESIRERGFVIQPFTDDLRAVAFDLDWTLSYYPLSTQQVLEQALIHSQLPIGHLGDLTVAARRYNELWLKLERSVESLDDLRIQIMTLLFEEQGFSDVATISRVSLAYEDVRSESGVLAYPDIDTLLADLQSRYKLGMYTNGPSFLQWKKIEALGFNRFFDAIIVAGDVGVYKPDPQAFALLSEALGVPASETLFVGDNFQADIVGAQRAGMYTAWIKHKQDVVIDGIQSSERLEAERIQPTFVLSETSRLREVLL